MSELTLWINGKPKTFTLDQPNPPSEAQAMEMKRIFLASNPTWGMEGKATSAPGVRPPALQGKIGGGAQDQYAPFDPMKGTIEQNGKPVKAQDVKGVQQIGAAAISGNPMQVLAAMGGTQKAKQVAPPVAQNPILNAIPKPNLGLKPGPDLKTPQGRAQAKINVQQAARTTPVETRQEFNARTPDGSGELKVQVPSRTGGYTKRFNYTRMKDGTYSVDVPGGEIVKAKGMHELGAKIKQEMRRVEDQRIKDETLAPANQRYAHPENVKAQKEKDNRERSLFIRKYGVDPVKEPGKAAEIRANQEKAAIPGFIKDIFGDDVFEKLTKFTPATAGTIEVGTSMVLGQGVDMVEDTKVMFDPNASWHERIGATINNALNTGIGPAAIGKGLKAFGSVDEVMKVVKGLSVPPGVKAGIANEIQPVKFEPKELPGYTSPGTLAEAGIKPTVKTKAPGKLVEAPVPVPKLVEAPKPIETPIVPKVVTPPAEGNIPAGAAYNAHTQAARVARGAPDVDKGGYLVPENAYEQGKAAVEAKKIDPRLLAKEVSEKPRQLDPHETGALTYDQARISTEMDEVSKLLDTETDPAKLAHLYERQQGLDLALDMNEQALQKAGTRQSEAFNARKMAADKNFSFVGLKRRFKGARTRELDDVELAETRKIADRVSALEGELQQAMIRMERMEAESAVRRSAGRVREALKGTLNAKFTTEDLAEAQKTLVSSLNAGATFDQIKAMRVIAGHYLERGAKTAEEVYKVIKAEVGDKIDDLSIWTAIRQATGEVGRSVNRGKSLGDDILTRGDYGFQDKAVQKLREALEMAKYDAQRYESRLKAKAEYEALSPWQKAGRQAVDALLLAPRSLKATLDFSAPLRQGIFLAVTNPKQSAQALGGMFKSWATEGGYRAIQGQVRGHDRFRQANKAGLYFSDVDAPILLGSREEQFASELVEKYVPGVRMSSRAYSGFLDKVRMDVFDHYITQFEKAGIKITDDLAKDVAMFINVASGRGHGPTVQAAAKLFGNVGFAPRYAGSRIQLGSVVLPLMMAKTSTGRKLIATQYAKFFGAAATTVGLLRAAGVDVQLDPKSTQFLKAKVGNGYVDIFGSVQQPFRILAQMVLGFTNQDGKAEDPNWTRSIGSFIDYKLNPTFANLGDIFEGRKISGETPDFWNVARDLLVPLSITEGVENFREFGPAGGAASTVGTIFGMSTNVISPDTDPIGRPYSTATRDDPYMKELARIGYETDLADRRKKDGEGRKERDVRAQQMGDFVMKRIRPLMDSPFYKGLTKLEKKELLTKETAKHRKEFNAKYSEDQRLKKFEERTKELQKQEKASIR